MPIRITDLQLTQFSPEVLEKMKIAIHDYLSDPENQESFLQKIADTSPNFNSISIARSEFKRSYTIHDKNLHQPHNK